MTCDSELFVLYMVDGCACYQGIHRKLQETKCANVHARGKPPRQHKPLSDKFRSQVVLLKQKSVSSIKIKSDDLLNV